MSGDLVREHVLRPGVGITGTISLRNRSEESLGVRIELADFLFHADGTSAFPEAGTLPRSLAGWLSVTPSTAVLPPGGGTTVSYTVQLPESADLRGGGTFWSVILVEGMDLAPADPVPPRPDDVELRPRLRHAVQIAVHVEGPARADADISSLRVDRSERAAPFLTFDLLNTGERAFRPSIRVQLSGDSGGPSVILREQRGLLFPGTGLRQSFPLESLPPGAYDILVTVDIGDPALIGARIRVEL